MSISRLSMGWLIYADEDVSNNPLLKELDWTQSWNVESMTDVLQINTSIGPDTVVGINLPSGGLRWLMILTDLPLDVLTYSGTVVPDPSSIIKPLAWTALTALGVWVEPMTDDQQVKDGIFFKRGTVTGLNIGNPDALLSANVKIIGAY